MFNRYLKILFHLLIIALVFVLQKGFLSGLFAFTANINLTIILVVFLLIFSKLELSLFYAVVFSVLFEVFSFSPTGLYAIAFMLTLLGANFLLVNFFTNRSLYSVVVLTFFSTVIFSFIFYSLLALYNFIFLVEGNIFYIKEFIKIEFLGLVFNLLTASIVFYFLNFLSKKVKPTFLVKSK